MSVKLYIPGPIQVSEKTFAAMATPMIGHRSKDFVNLYQGLQPRLQALFYTQDPVFVSTSSAWGVMEGAIRNLVGKKVLNCMNGSFADKWHDVSKRCGKPAEALKFDWGQPVTPEALKKELATGQYDVVTLIHNETSTGCMSNLVEVMPVIKEFPEVISVVDTVSSFSGVPIKKDALGIDVMLTGSQKALALPPGMALFSVSQRAMDRAKTIEGRGYYFDFLEFLKNHEKGMTPSTPCISTMFALRSKLDEIDAEGLEQRYARHAKTNAMVHGWVEKNGFSLFPPKAYASKTLTCANNDRGIDLEAFNKSLRERHSCIINTGYGKIKGKTFRISNMGDETEETIETLLGQLDDILKNF